MTTEHCHTYQGHHIPGCYGCAIYGGVRGHAASCTCPPARPRVAPEQDAWDTTIEARIAALEARIAQLEGRA